MKRTFTLCAALLFVAPIQAANVTIDGTKYRDPVVALEAYQRLIDARLEAIPASRLRDLNLPAMGGRLVVVMPTAVEATQNFVWVRGPLKPSRETQETIARTELIKLRANFRLMERVGFIQIAQFREQGAALPESEYVVTFRSAPTGDRSKASVDARRTEFVLRSVRTGREAVALVATGSPGSIPENQMYSGFKAAAQEVDRALTL